MCVRARVSTDQTCTPPTTPRSLARSEQALDSAFGAGTRGHVLATISTTLEAVVFNSVASNAPREYPDGLNQGLFFSIVAMLVFTWAVVVIELAVPVGREHEDEGEPPRLLLRPPSPRLPLLGRLAPSSPSFSRPGSAPRKTPTTMVHVQPSASSLVMSGTDSTGSSESERIEDGRQKPGGGRGGKGAAVVVPIEG